MKKQNVTKLQRISGIFLGLGLIILTFSLAMSAVFLNEDFWLKQNDKYNYREQFGLVSNDDYSALYHNYVEILKNNQAPDKEFAVTLQSDPSEFVNTFIECEETVNSPTKITKSVTLTKEYLDTVSAVAKNKGETLKDAMRFQFAFKPLGEETPVETTLNVLNVKVFDNTGKTYDYVIKKYFYNDHGALVGMDIDDETNVDFNTANILGIVILGEIGDNVSVELNVQSELSNYTVETVFSYKEMLTNKNVASRIGYEANIVTFEERQALYNVGAINAMQKLVAIGVCIASVLFTVMVVVKQKREALLGIGFYAFVTILIVAIGINIASAYVPSAWGFSLVLDFPPNSVTGTILGQNFMNDFKTGAIRFFDFTTLFPLFATYVLSKIARRNKQDDDGDYLYQ